MSSKVPPYVVTKTKNEFSVRGTGEGQNALVSIIVDCAPPSSCKRRKFYYTRDEGYYRLPERGLEADAYLAVFEQNGAPERYAHKMLCWTLEKLVKEGLLFRRSYIMTEADGEEGDIFVKQFEGLGFKFLSAHDETEREWPGEAGGLMGATLADICERLKNEVRLYDLFGPPSLPSNATAPASNRADTLSKLAHVRRVLTRWNFGNSRQVNLEIQPNQYINVIGHAHVVRAHQAPKMDVTTTIRVYQEAGVKAVISLDRHNLSRFKIALNNSNIAHYLINIQDFQPPSIDNIREIIGYLSRHIGETVAIHCGEGWGRTGTVLTALLLTTPFGNIQARKYKHKQGILHMGHYSEEKTLNTYVGVIEAINLIREKDWVNVGEASFENKCDWNAIKDRDNRSISCKNNTCEDFNSIGTLCSVETEQQVRFLERIYRYQLSQVGTGKTVRRKKQIKQTVEELKAKCKRRGIRGYSRLRKNELIQLLSGHRNTAY